MGRQRYPQGPKGPKGPQNNTMKNKQLYIRRIERIEGALRAIEVSLGQRDTTIQTIKQRLDVVNSEVEEIKSMVEREN